MGRVKFAAEGPQGATPPPWNKDHAPYNCLAWLIDKERVKEGMKPQKVHELLPQFTQYNLDNFRPNYKYMMKKYKAGTLTYNVRIIPENVMKMLQEGNYGGFRSQETQNDVNKAMEGKL